MQSILYIYIYVCITYAIILISGFSMYNEKTNDIYVCLFKCNFIVLYCFLKVLKSIYHVSWILIKWGLAFVISRS